MTVASALLNSPVDANYAEFQNGFCAQVVSGAVVTATDSTAVFQLPYMFAGGKVKLVVELTALSGSSSPSLTVTYEESVDGVNFNATAALTSGALTATGTVYSAVATGPVFNQGKLIFTVNAGTTPSFTVNVYVVAWNK